MEFEFETVWRFSRPRRWSPLQATPPLSEGQWPRAQTLHGADRPWPVGSGQPGLAHCCGPHLVTPFPRVGPRPGCSLFPMIIMMMISELALHLSPSWPWNTSSWGFGGSPQSSGLSQMDNALAALPRGTHSGVRSLVKAQLDTARPLVVGRAVGESVFPNAYAVWCRKTAKIYSPKLQRPESDMKVLAGTWSLLKAVGGGIFVVVVIFFPLFSHFSWLLVILGASCIPLQGAFSSGCLFL